MAGIYIHVPFCKTKCIYCDFFTQTNMGKRSHYIDALCKELYLRKSYLGGETIHTIYFGGGTPSQLFEEDFVQIFDAIFHNFEIATDCEITLEANPDDMKEEYIAMLKTLPFNRISMGVQTFNDDELRFLNRRHSAQGAKDAVKRCQEIGFNNISIDLIYGLPKQTMHVWKQNLDEAISLDIQHLSSYHLIYEEGTKLFKLLETGRVKSIEEELSVDMFATMIETLEKANFVQYEISNFAKNGQISRHNSSYWLGEKYLGLGPSAHSYNGINRCWNISSITKYIDAIDREIPNIEEEILDLNTKYNDFILTGMRTMWGINLDQLEKLFGQDLLKYCMKNVEKHIKNQNVTLDGKQLKITKKGIFTSDGIMSDLMFVD